MSASSQTLSSRSWLMSETAGLVRDRSERSQQWFDLEATGPKKTHSPGSRCDQHGPFKSNNVQWWLYDHFHFKLSKTNTMWRYTLSDCKILLKRNGSPVYIIMDQWQTAFSKVFSSSYPYLTVPFYIQRCLDTLFHWNTFTFKLLLCKNSNKRLTFAFLGKYLLTSFMVKYVLNLWQRFVVQKWLSSWNCIQKLISFGLHLNICLKTNED